MILNRLNRSQDLIEFVEDRPGHDYRYSLEISKVKRLGWKPKTSFEEGLKKTIKYYVNSITQPIKIYLLSAFKDRYSLKFRGQ